VLPDDRTIVIEEAKFRRATFGDWRVVVHSLRGWRPCALGAGHRCRDPAVHRLRTRRSCVPMTASCCASPDAESDQQVREATSAVCLEPEEIEQVVTDHVAGSALFASAIPRGSGPSPAAARPQPGKRSPLWQQRQRSAHLLEASAEPTFPIVLETVRECLQDIYDVPALIQLAERMRSGEVSIVEVQTSTPSPSRAPCSSGTWPHSCTRGCAPCDGALPPSPWMPACSPSCSGPRGPGPARSQALQAKVEAELQHLAADRHARDVEDAADLLASLGPLSRRPRLGASIPGWLAELRDARRAIEVHWTGSMRWTATAG
jgi:ATP-dependent Lhr-like helicase